MGCCEEEVRAEAVVGVGFLRRRRRWGGGGLGRGGFHGQSEVVVVGRALGVLVGLLTDTL